jgi:hypothetical protein
VQTADAGLRLKAYLLKEGFYAVLALLDMHYEGFFSAEKTRDAEKARDAEERRKKQSDDAMRGPIAALAAKQPRLGSYENPYGSQAAKVAAARIRGVPLQNWQYASALAAADYEDGGVVGKEYVFALLGPASLAARVRVPLPEVLETFSPYLSKEAAIARVMFALQREVSDARLLSADAQLSQAGLTVEDQGRTLADFFSNAELGNLMAQGVFLGNHDQGWPISVEGGRAGGNRPAPYRFRNAHPPPETGTAAGGGHAFGPVLTDSFEDPSVGVATEERLAPSPSAVAREGAVAPPPPREERLAPSPSEVALEGAVAQSPPREVAPEGVVAPPPLGAVPAAPQLGPAPRASFWDRLRWGGRNGASA